MAQLRNLPSRDAGHPRTIALMTHESHFRDEEARLGVTEANTARHHALTRKSLVLHATQDR